MLSGLMWIVGGIGLGLIIQYGISSLKTKKQGLDKKQISEELVELLKE